MSSSDFSAKPERSIPPVDQRAVLEEYLFDAVHDHWAVSNEYEICRAKRQSLQAETGNLPIVPGTPMEERFDYMSCCIIQNCPEINVKMVNNMRQYSIAQLHSLIGMVSDKNCIFIGAISLEEYRIAGLESILSNRATGVTATMALQDSKSDIQTTTSTATVAADSATKMHQISIETPPSDPASNPLEEWELIADAELDGADDWEFVAHDKAHDF
ncbi:MAG: hypothetical protein Q9181_002915 [Wetmoreana brouardii]